jgi:hypothetical protein
MLKYNLKVLPLYRNLRGYIIIKNQALPLIVIKFTYGIY